MGYDHETTNTIVRVCCTINGDKFNRPQWAVHSVCWDVAFDLRRQGSSKSRPDAGHSISIITALDFAFSPRSCVGRNAL